MRRYLLWMIILSAMLSGCAAQPAHEPVHVVSPEETELLRLENRLSQLESLNVSIQVFTSSAAQASSLYNSAAQVRSVESRYLPFILKQTMDHSGFWGAVRVMPRHDPNAELIVEGVILDSDGVALKLFIRARDATGRIWLEQQYGDFANEIDYARDPDFRIDPFQDLFNRIANDLVEVQKQLDEKTHDRLLDITMARYAAELSPESFAGFIAETESGQLELLGLPARDDPVFKSVQRIRESEYLFADAVDAHYESLYQRVGPTYAWWRYYGYELILGNEKLRRVDATRGATRGSWYSMERIYKTYKESKMNEDALRELTNSFDKETEPTITEIAGKVVQLTGSLDNQYDEWREILRALYKQQTEL